MEENRKLFAFCFTESVDRKHITGKFDPQSELWVSDNGGPSAGWTAEITSQETTYLTHQPNGGTGPDEHQDYTDDWFGDSESDVGNGTDGWEDDPC